MRIIDYLDRLNWTQTRLSQEAHVSTSTVQRLVQAKSISRQNADKICDTLSRALGYKVELHDVNEVHVIRAERPERRKQPPTSQGLNEWLAMHPQEEQKSPEPENQDQGNEDQGNEG